MEDGPEIRKQKAINKGKSQPKGSGNLPDEDKMEIELIMHTIELFGLDNKEVFLELPVRLDGTDTVSRRCRLQ